MRAGNYRGRGFKWEIKNVLGVNSVKILSGDLLTDLAKRFVGFEISDDCAWAGKVYLSRRNRLLKSLFAELLSVQVQII